MLCKCGNPILNVPAHLLDCGIGLICRLCAVGPETVYVPKPYLCSACGKGEPEVAFLKYSTGRLRDVCLTCKPRTRPGRKLKE